MNFRDRIYTKAAGKADNFYMRTVCFSSLHSHKAREKQGAAFHKEMALWIFSCLPCLYLLWNSNTYLILRMTHYFLQYPLPVHFLSQPTYRSSNILYFILIENTFRQCKWQGYIGINSWRSFLRGRASGKEKHSTRIHPYLNFIPPYRKPLCMRVRFIPMGYLTQS